MKWINIKDQKPNKNSKVIIYFRDGTMDISTFNEEFEPWYTNLFFYNKNKITHWMPLPPKPEAD